MSLHVYENTLVRPLYFDALSGEFYPPSDKANNAHTLGRLAFAAILKGDKTTYDELDVTDYRYTPSWAPNVVAVAKSLDDPENLSSELVGLRLQSTDHSLNLLDATVEWSESSGIIIVTDDKEGELPLILGPELAVARTATTEAAQAFFDQAYAKLNQ